jgi:hypothetical protein
MNKTTKRAKHVQAKELTAGLKGMKWLGVVITWNSGPEGATHGHSKVMNALGVAGLDTKYERELLPRNAFQRAAKKLSDERIIDVFREDERELVFQFTRKHLNSLQWEFRKETFVSLNKNTGKVLSDDKAIALEAQAEVDKAMDLRTNADVTRIVNRLFEDHADLIPMRDAGGVYFVPQEHCGFVARVETFLTQLGGRIDQIPVPAGTATGDRTIQNAVSATMAKLIEDHMDAVKKFEPATRKDTIQRQADEIKHTRIKIEAYAHYLGERQSELIKKISEANKLLKEQVEAIGGGAEAYSEYDWNTILDGKVHKLVQGEDYLATTRTCLVMARAHAKKQGMRIRSRIMDEGKAIVMQAVPMKEGDKEESDEE